MATFAALLFGRSPAGAQALRANGCAGELGLLDGEDPTVERWRSDTPAQPPPRRFPTRLFVGLGLFIVLPALVICACWVWYGNPLTRPPLEAANRILAAIDAGDHHEAASMTEPCFNPLYAEPLTVEVLQRSFPGEIEYDLSVTEADALGWDISRPNATFKGTVEIANQPTQSIVLRVQKLEDDWRVCAYTLTDS